jgi:hypothetical protein
VKTIKIFITGLLLSGASWAQAQTPEPAPSPDTAPALETAPPALSQAASKPENEVAKAIPATPAFVRKPQFSFAMGSQFSRFGHAAYLQPTVSLPLTPRLQAFASVQFMNSFGPTFYRAGAEAGSLGLNSRGQQAYVVMAGGQYAVSEKLNITGSIWRDLSRYSGMPQYLANPFPAAGSQGMMFRAQYKVNDRFSVSGGVRYGAHPGDQGYNRSFYPDYNSPFGF